MIWKKQFEAYYKEYVNHIYNYVYYKVYNDSDLAYDITSQTFYKALYKLETFDETKNFKTWIYQIAHNTIIDYYRIQKENISLDEIENLMYYYDGIDDIIDKKMKLKQIYTQMNTLSWITKQIIILKVFEDMSYDEIGNILQMNVWACKMQFKRGIDQIKSLILQLLLFFLFI